MMRRSSRRRRMTDDTAPRIPDAAYDRHLVETIVWYDATAMRFAEEKQRAEAMAAAGRRCLIQFRATGERG